MELQKFENWVKKVARAGLKGFSLYFGMQYFLGCQWVVLFFAFSEVFWTVFR